MHIPVGKIADWYGGLCCKSVRFFQMIIGSDEPIHDRFDSHFLVTGTLKLLTNNDHKIIVHMPPNYVDWDGYKRWTFSDSMDRRTRFVTLQSVVSAVCIAQNLYLADSLLIV